MGTKAGYKVCFAIKNLMLTSEQRLCTLHYLLSVNIDYIIYRLHI